MRVNWLVATVCGFLMALAGTTGELYAQARRRCVSCGTTDKCLRWLDEPPKSGKGPDFCPNLSLFDAWAPGGTGPVLKTDLFEDAHGGDELLSGFQ